MFEYKSKEISCTIFLLIFTQAWFVESEFRRVFILYIASSTVCQIAQPQISKRQLFSEKSDLKNFGCPFFRILLCFRVRIATNLISAGFEVHSLNHYSAGLTCFSSSVAETDVLNDSEVKTFNFHFLPTNNSQILGVHLCHISIIGLRKF